MLFLAEQSTGYTMQDAREVMDSSHNPSRVKHFIHASRLPIKDDRILLPVLLGRQNPSG